MNQREIQYELSARAESRALSADVFHSASVRYTKNVIINVPAASSGVFVNGNLVFITHQDAGNYTHFQPSSASGGLNKCNWCTMKYIFLITTLFFFTSAFSGHEEKTKEVRLKQGNGQVKVSVRVEEIKIKTDDNLTYFWIKSGEIHNTQGGYEGNLLHGEYTEFYLSEQLKSKGNFKNGLKDGEWKSWYENGNIEEIIHWKNGRINGKVIKYTGDGTKTEKKYVNGVEKVKKKNSSVRSRPDKQKEKEIIPLEEKTEENAKEEKEKKEKKKHSEKPQKKVKEKKEKAENK